MVSRIRNKLFTNKIPDCSKKNNIQFNYNLEKILKSFLFCIYHSFLSINL